MTAKIIIWEKTSFSLFLEKKIYTDPVTLRTCRGAPEREKWDTTRKTQMLISVKQQHGQQWSVLSWLVRQCHERWWWRDVDAAVGHQLLDAGAGVEEGVQRGHRHHLRHVPRIRAHVRILRIQVRTVMLILFPLSFLDTKTGKKYVCPNT